MQFQINSLLRREGALLRCREWHAEGGYREHRAISTRPAADVDTIEYVPWQSMGAVEADPRLSSMPVEGPFMDVLFNGTRPPFNDARVRRAIGHAIKRDGCPQQVRA